MSYCSITNADVFALTRQRRSERRESRRQAYIAIYGPTRYFCPSPLAEPLKAVQADPGPTSRATFRHEMKWMREARRDRLLKAQGGCCYLCDGRFGFEVGAPTEDHVRPRSSGGGRERNILMACFPCNQAKANRHPTQRELATLARINAALDAEEISEPARLAA